MTILPHTRCLVRSVSLPYDFIHIYCLISLFLSGSGAIEFDEFVKMYRTLRTKPMDCSKTIRALFCKLDTDNDGHLGFR